MYQRKARRSASEYGRVGVLYGGNSGERAVSLKSGQRVHKALKARGVDSVLIDAANDVVSAFSDQGVNRVFNALHGRGGEDGRMQGLLDTIGMPYTGSGVMASSVTMNKVLTKQVWIAAGLPTPEFRVIRSEAELSGMKEFCYPCFVKPALEGSSLGMSRVESFEELPAAWRKAKEFCSEVLVEQFIDGAEYTIGILDSTPLPVIRLETDNVFYDYEAKYQSNDTRYIVPCGLSKEKEQALQAMALEAFRLTECEGWGRVDLMLDQQQNPWLLEINTIPGMTDHSLVPMAAREVGLDFDELVMEILETSYGG
ncbi:D-alanine--D-alanine ligase [Endozoicomonadaceae bacterium StTr2]